MIQNYECNEIKIKCSEFSHTIDANFLKILVKRDGQSRMDSQLVSVNSSRKVKWESELVI